jgi:hypothetical protein
MRMESKMRKVWKYEMPDQREFTLDMPDADICLLHVAVQNGKPVLWAEVETEANKRPQHFLRVGTGGCTIPLTATYVGTYFQGPFVWHLYHNS